MFPKQIKGSGTFALGQGISVVIVTLTFLESLLCVRHCANNHFRNLKEES